jgi:hypothetical protein
MIPVETAPKIRGAGKGVNLNMIYLIHCKNFCKYSNIPSPNITIVKTRKVIGERIHVD